MRRVRRPPEVSRGVTQAVVSVLRMSEAGGVCVHDVRRQGVSPLPGVRRAYKLIQCPIEVIFWRVHLGLTEAPREKMVTILKAGALI